MNPKALGEKGVRIVIGELAKFDVDVAVPLTDNLPWDIVVVYGKQLYKVQVKSSRRCRRNCTGSIVFDLSSNNWYKKTIKKYTEDDCDAMMCCDFENVYVLGPEHFRNRREFSVRKLPPKNGQLSRIHQHSDFVLSRERLAAVFGDREIALPESVT
jgi:hypothetical protein